MNNLLIQKMSMHYNATARVLHLLGRKKASACGLGEPFDDLHIRPHEQCSSIVHSNLQLHFNLSAVRLEFKNVNHSQDSSRKPRRSLSSETFRLKVVQSLRKGIEIE